MPRWPSNLPTLVAAWLAIMLAAALWMPHEWDWTAFELMSAHAPPPEFSSRIAIVNVPLDKNDIPSFRRRIAAVLDDIVARGPTETPSAVILDVEFDPCRSGPSCGTAADSARAALIAAIAKAEPNFRVYATEEFPVDTQGDTVGGPLDDRDPQIYAAVTAAAHTIFTPVGGTSGLFYRRCYAGVPFNDASNQAVGVQSVWSMVDRVLPDFKSTPCDETHVPVRLGPKLVTSAPPVYTVIGQQRLPADLELKEKYVIVAAIDQDPGNGERSGPELLAWALSDQLAMGSVNATTAPYYTTPQNATLLAVVPAFSGLTVLAYAAFFYRLKRARLRQLRTSLPWLATTLSVVAGLGIFAAFEFMMYAGRQIYPQVSLIGLGIIVTGGLSGFRGYRIISDEADAVDAAPEEMHDYDVFISYAHEEGAWVSENVYAPLRDAVLPNGKKLSIFFDTSSLRSGTAWQSTLSAAIEGSRFIVPVYSEIYFTKPYCRFEIRRAHRKWILAGEASRCVLPIMRGHPKIDPSVDDIQALSLDDHPDLVAQVVREIVTRVAAIRASAEAAPANALQPGRTAP